MQTPLYETRLESFGVQIHVLLPVMVDVERGGGLSVSQSNVVGGGGKSTADIDLYRDHFFD